jgi:hypothetical protein
MPHLPYLYELSPLWILQAVMTVWMLVDASRRGVDFWWFWIILVFQPFGAWAYFFLYKVKDFQGGHGWLTNLFHRPPSLEELRHRAERSPTVANRLDLGERLVQTGAYAEAVPHIEAMLAREPDHCRALHLLARCRRGLGAPAEAVPLLQKVIARHPTWEDYRAWHALIETCGEIGDREAVLKHCHELARLSPCLEHRCLLAEHLLATGDKGEARRVVEQGLDDYRYATGLSRRRDRAWVGKARQLLKQVE